MSKHDFRKMPPGAREVYKQNILAAMADYQRDLEQIEAIEQETGSYLLQRFTEMPSGTMVRCYSEHTPVWYADKRSPKDWAVLDDSLYVTDAVLAQKAAGLKVSRVFDWLRISKV